MQESGSLRISEEDLWGYLDEAVLPEVRNRQVRLTAKPQTLEYLLGEVTRLVDDKHAQLHLPEVSLNR